MGRVFGMSEWQGGGPAQRLHVHHEDDEAWHVLDGSVEFRFADGRREMAGPGTTVFVPAGVAHTYVTSDDARYLIVLTPQLEALIGESAHRACGAACRRLPPPRVQLLE